MAVVRHIRYDAARMLMTGCKEVGDDDGAAGGDDDAEAECSVCFDALRGEAVELPGCAHVHLQVVIQADTIHAAVEQILHDLREDTSTRSSRNRENVIYFDGWDGLGASAVLRAVGQRLAVATSEAPAGLQFDQIIYVDCSNWESRRALQRVIVEQLDELPAEVMEMLDKQDEDDDFHGVPQGSRNEMPEVLDATYQHMQKLSHRFIVIFQNGSSEEIDLTTFGFPVYGYSRNKLLWTFQGSLRLYPRMKVDRALKSTAATDVFLSASHREKDPLELWRYLVRQEAVQIARRNAAGSLLDQPDLISKCFFYTLKQCCMGSQFMDYGFSIHCGNYWICDGIIHLQKQGEGDNQADDGDDCGSWRAADALQREMRLDVDYCRHSHLVKCAEIIPCWTSPSYRVTQILDDGTIANGGIFQHYDKLCVLKLSSCSFSFSSPPFLCCRNLRFLWLHHCQDSNQVPRKIEASAEEEIRYCFQRLWVLDVRYTPCEYWILSPQMMALMTQLRELIVMGAQDWDIGQLHGRLPNIHKLRVTKSVVRCSGHSKHDLFSSMDKLQLLDFSGNHTKQEGGGAEKLFGLSTSSNKLETVMITDGCVGIQKLGCAKLKNLLLSGLFEDLRIIVLSGSAVKQLDLGAITAQSLEELILDNCDKLCSILWPPEDKMKSDLKKLYINTTRSAASLVQREEKSMEVRTTVSAAATSLSMAHGGRSPSEFSWRLMVRDARLLGSLVFFEKHFDKKVLIHVEIYSPNAAFSSSNNNKTASIKQQHVLVKMDEPTDSFVYADDEVTFKDHPLLQPSQGDAPTLTQRWPCPSIPSPILLTCYTHIQDHQLSSKSLPQGEQTMTSIVIPDMICRNACILHVHDSLSITSIPGPAPALGSTWKYLEWCRVERCPKLEHAFTAPQLQESGVVVVFDELRTFWASELSKARYIWNWTPVLVFQFAQRAFGNFKLLHMDLCPRVIHVLPLALQMVNINLGQLETLEIMWCGNLREVFPLYTTDAKSGQQQQTTTVHFQQLKHIHLHELPKLQGICGQWRISAPELKTVKIRGCWSLKHLPAVSNNTNNKVECDCEKEWWDMLEWDGLRANHHPSLYNPTHSRYYKKTHLKGSVLR